MATVIDSLIVTLGLDNKDFQQGMKDTEKGLSDTRKNTDRVGKQIAASGKDAAEFFGQPDIDGALVGGASLKIDEFAAITKAAAS